MKPSISLSLTMMTERWKDGKRQYPSIFYYGKWKSPWYFQNAL